MNKCIFLGNITRDSEVSYSNNQMKIARTSIALNRGKTKDGKDKGTDFVNLVGFDKTADFMEKFVTKGRRFMVEARVQTGSYKNQKGDTVYTTDFVVDSIEFADSKPATQPAEKPAETAPTDADGFMNLDGIEEGELPFV